MMEMVTEIDIYKEKKKKKLQQVVSENKQNPDDIFIFFGTKNKVWEQR